MKKILMAFAEPFEYGGQEAFALNMYKYINHKEYSIDFFTPYNLSNEKAKEILNENKNQIFYCNKKFDSILRKVYFKNCLKKFIKEHNDYEIVHLNSGSTFALAEGAKICKKHGIKEVIVHSHATGFSNLKHKITKILSAYKFKYADTFIACSDKAAEFRFPKIIINKNKYFVLKNGIDINNFKFDINVRNKCRKELNIKEGEFVLGNVGRLSPEKNQKFIIDIFKKMIDRDENCKLVLVGTGILEKKIIEYIKEKGLEEKFILLKNRSDVNVILQAIDVFLFPSLYEGLGIAAIEAQTSGLPTFCSKNVPEDANVTPLFRKLNLSDNVDLWVNEIEKIKQYKRNDYSKEIEHRGYDIKNTVLELEKIYSKRGNK